MTEKLIEIIGLEKTFYLSEEVQVRALKGVSLERQPAVNISQ